MTAAAVRKKVAEIEKKYGTRDPEKLCAKMGIQLFYRDDFTKLRGMYAVILRTRCIFVNSNLSDEYRKMTVAHEMGHDFFHRELAKSGVIRDQMIIDMKLKPEYEANLFAAELLIPDEDILPLAESGADVFEAAKLLFVDPSMVTLKLRILKEEGKNFNDTFFDPDFIK